LIANKNFTMKTKPILTLLLLIWSLSQVSAQYITTNNSLSAEQLIQDTLITGCVTADNITTNNSDAYGYFNNNGTSFPFESGLIMASGPIENAEGPDDATSQGGSLSSNSDPDLAMLTSYTVNDATVIEFDFVPASDTIRFNYIFGSEEFPEFANSSYNDVFGFFISGPGISGPYSNSAINIALLPNGQPVTIDNVYNSGTWYNGPTSGSGGTGQAYNNTVEYDGCTDPLTAEVILTACETYHIKLAIGDAGDSNYDSGVFIEAGSFTSGVQINAVNHSDVGSDADLYEGCTNYFALERAPNSPIDEFVTIYINYLNESTAEEGVDVSTVVDSAYMAPYETVDTIWYSAFNDGIEEGTETMILEFWTSCPCGNGGGNSVIDTIFVYDVESIKGGIQDVQNNYCGEAPPPTLDLVAEVEVSPSYYEWSTGSTNDTITIIPQPGAETFYVTISDQCGNELYDSITVRVSSMSVEDIDISHVSCYNECDGEVTIDVQNDFAPFQFTYGNAMFFYIPDSLTTTYENTFTGLCPKNYYLKITDDIGCQIETDFQINNKPNILLSDGIMPIETEYCGNPGEISMTATSIVDNANYSWWNGTGNPTVNFTPMLGTNTYGLSITDACGNLFSDEVEISVSELSAEGFSEPDISGTCNGEAWAFPSNGIPPYNFYWYNPIALFGQYQEDLCAGEYTVQITDGIGCSIELDVEVEFLVNIANNENSGIKIYPNPASSHAFIDLSGLNETAVTIKISTITGQDIGVFKTTKSQFKTPDLSAGSYLIDIMVHGNQVYKDKLIITE